MYKNIKVIAFDADDTLWVNETYFREAEHQFAKLLANGIVYCSRKFTKDVLLL